MRASRIRRHAALLAALALIVGAAWQQVREGPQSASAASGTSIGSFDGLRVAVSDSVIAPPPEDFGAPPDAPEAPPAAIRFGRVTPQSGTWAVVIGVNDYPGSRHDLRAAVNDANTTAAALLKLGVPAQNVLVLRDRQVNRATISQSVDWLNAHAGPDAVGVFFFAGHVRKSGGREAMVGADGSLFSDAELAGKLSGLRAKRAWIAMAACYGGGFTEVLAPGRVLTGAAGANQLAYENSMYNRSYMVEYMLQRAVLDGRSPATVQSAFEWARSALSRDHPNRLPVQIDRGAGALDLRPAKAPTAARPRSAPASPPAAPSGGGSGSSPRPGSSPVPTAPAPPRTGEDGCQVSALGVKVCRS